jgi:hypothetical protein
MDSPQQKELNLFTIFAKDLIAGTFAGITSTVFGHPLDTIKVRSYSFLIMILFS